MHVAEEVGQWWTCAGAGAEVVDPDVGEFRHVAVEGRHCGWFCVL